MSLVIKKFQEGGSPEVRRYRRGNDEVDLDAFVRLAEVGFNDWLDKANIKEKYKNEVRAAYQDMITRINSDPESFAARLGGGFTNTAGITNKTKGFDAYGVAAGYLGNTLRNMSVYRKPEVKSDKQKYNRNSRLITSPMLEQVLGNSLESFIKLDDDSYDETTGRRGLTNRTALTIAGLTAIKNNLRDYYDFDSEDDYNHAIARIDNSIAILLNANPNDDWFSLSQLGLTGVDRYFSTGVERGTTPLSQEELVKLNASKDFEDWVNTNYPIYTGTLHGQVNLSNSSDLPISHALRTEFNNNFKNLSDDDLKKWILEYISNIDSYNINNNNFMRKVIKSGIPNFSTGQVLSAIINRLRDSGQLHQFSLDSTKYYIPGTAKYDNTAYVWDSATNTLHHMSIHDIPYWLLKITAEYNNGNSYLSLRYPQMYASHKQGGIIKAQQGVKFDNILGALTYLPEDLTDDRRLRNIYADGAFTQQPRTTSATDLVSPGNNQYDPEPGGPELEQLDYYKNWLNILTTNEPVAEAWARRYKALQPTTNVHYSPWFNSDDTFNFEQFKNALVNNKKVYSDAVNGIGHDFYRGRVYQILDQNGNPLAGYYNEPQDGYELVGDPILDKGNLAWVYQMRKANVTPKDQPKEVNIVTGSGEDNPDNGPKGGNRNQSELNEVYTNQNNPNPSLTKLNFGELGVNLLGAGRLIGSIIANNRIARTVRESLRPKLHNTYELYSPVTGAFSEMQLRNRQGAETLSQAYRPFTSDASLAAARMFEGQRHANDLLYQGFIADDREIKRTLAEALKRQEDNVARRSALANENRDAIIANNQALAQLEASRIKLNWLSIDNYLQGVEGRVRNRIAENRDRRNQFLMQTGLFGAQQERKARINEIMDDFRAYKALPGNETKTLSDFNNDRDGRYELAIASINADYEMAQLANFAKIYGYEFTPPKDYKPYNRNYYNLTVRRHGGPIRLSASQLIDKIIRNNESNS